MEIEQNIIFDEFKNKLIILENSLIDVQNDNYDKEDINEIFRAIHTIKGTADLLGMFDIVTITHKAEDLLEYVRDDKIKINNEICILYLELKKFIAKVLENISQGIFDDFSVEKLFINLEKEFNYQIRIAETSEHQYEDLKTILVIEDSALVRYTIKKIASDEGYNVITSDNEEDGWQKIQNNQVDLLFCDFTNSNQNAQELVKKIRADSETKELAIVMLLSKLDAESSRLGKSILAKAWLGKPIEEKKLKVILEKLLAKSS